MKKIDTVIFDLGGVLIDWNPRYLYRKLFQTEEEISWFLENICTSEWNDQQDAGRSFSEATEELVSRHPEWETPIRAWYGRWQETVSGPVHGTVEILQRLKSANKHKLLALTNWSAETFPWAQSNFEFLSWFEGIVVSGHEKVCKPDPRIYRILLDRHQITPHQSVFIDDNLKNVKGAAEIGIHAIHFQTPEQLEDELLQLGLLNQK